MPTTTDMHAIAAPIEATMREFCTREHLSCFACKPAALGGLGLSFSVQTDGSVISEWKCPAGFESYAGIIHGGILATAMDSAMVHQLFSRGITARTGELSVRYRKSVRISDPLTITARLREAHRPLFLLDCEIFQLGFLCVRASAKFMEIKADNPPLMLSPQKE